MILGLTHDEQGRPRQSLSISIKVAIGLGPDEKQGRKAPQKLDYFVFLTKQGAELKWGQDKALTEHYQKKSGAKPREVAIILMADDPEDVFRTQYAWWTSKERHCWSGTKKENGGYVQIATRRTEKNPDGEQWSPPNPCGPGCPDLEEGDCKPSGDLYFVLADFPALGSVCRLHTSGYRSIGQIYSSLEQLRNTFGGRLTGLRVMLRVRPEKTIYVSADGKKHSTTMYALSLELTAKDMKDLVEKAAENAKLFRETRLLLGGRPPRIEYKDEAEEAKEIAAEFYPQEEKPQGRIIRGPAPAQKPPAASDAEEAVEITDCDLPDFSTAVEEVKPSTETTPAKSEVRGGPAEDVQPSVQPPSDQAAPDNTPRQAHSPDTIFIKFHGKRGSMMATLWGRTDIIAVELEKNYGGKHNKAQGLWLVSAGWAPYINELCEQKNIHWVEKE